MPARGVARLLGLLLLPMQVALAQQTTAVAALDRETIRVNESFNYTLTVEGELPGRPDFSVLEVDFDRIGREGVTSGYRFAGGRSIRINEWVVLLMPKRPGQFEIPPVSIGNVRSNPVAVEILPAEQGGTAPGDIFIEVELDRETGYVQAQAIYTLRLFVGVEARNANLSAPSVSGGEAIVEKIGQDREYQTVRGDRVFTVRERRYAIFPQTTGRLGIGPIVFEALTIPSFGFTRSTRVTSDAVELEVMPAVPPPASHSRAVWLPATSMRIDEVWPGGSPGVFVQGEPRTRVLTIVADGLLETQLPELTMAATPAIRQYANQPEFSRDVRDDGIQARRTQRVAVIAMEPGRIELPAVELPWWNVAEGRWETARVEASAIEVLAAEEIEPVSEAGAGPLPDAAPSPGRWPWLAGALALGWLATAAAWLLTARRGGLPRPKPEAGRPLSGRSLVRQLVAACRVDDTRRARDLLLDWSALRFPDEPPASLSALAGKLEGPLAGEVAGLEAALYGRSSREWKGARLAELLCEEPPPARPGGRENEDPLAPLYR